MEKSAYEIAKAGGRHKGLYQAWKNKPISEIEKSIRSLREQIGLHLDKIANPNKYITENILPLQRDGLINRYWPKEVANFRQQINVLDGILRERNHGQKA